jgi:hypothetical protein
VTRMKVTVHDSTQVHPGPGNYDDELDSKPGDDASQVLVGWLDDRAMIGPWARLRRRAAAALSLASESSAAAMPVIRAGPGRG